MIQKFQRFAFIRKFARFIAEKFGYRYLLNWIYIKENYKYFSKLKKLNSKLKSKHFVVFHGVRTMPSVSTPYIESILGHAFRLRGARVASLICGGFFLECDADSHFDKPKDYCKFCNFGRKEFIDSLGIDNFFYKDYLSDQAIQEVNKELDLLFSKTEKNFIENQKKFFYKGVNVGYSAWSSVVRYYQTAYFKKNAESFLKFRQYLERAMLLVNIAESFLAREKPTILITLHGIYTTWEPFYRFFSNKGITVYVYEFCMADIHGVRFVKNARNNEYLNLSLWKDLQRSNIPETEKKEYDQFLEDRFSYKRGYVTVLTEGVELDELNRHDYYNFIKRTCKYRYVLFTNIPWDAALINADIIFEDIFEWFDETLNFFIQNPEHHLVIKVHPAEWLEKHSYTFTDYLRDKYPNLPNNIFFVNNVSKLKPYEIFDDVDLGIVYNGTIGLEMAIKGKPVIALGATHYSRAGNVVFPVKDKGHYFELIKDPSPVKDFSRVNIENAYKYGYLFFRKCELPLPFLYEGKYVVLNRKSLKNVAQFAQKDPYIDAIVTQILLEEEVVRP